MSVVLVWRNPPQGEAVLEGVFSSPQFAAEFIELETANWPADQ